MTHPSGTVYYASSGTIWEYDGVIFVCLEGYTRDLKDGDELRSIYVLDGGGSIDPGPRAFAFSSPYDNRATRLA